MHFINSGGAKTPALQFIYWNKTNPVLPWYVYASPYACGGAMSSIRSKSFSKLIPPNTAKRGFPSFTIPHPVWPKHTPPLNPSNSHTSLFHAGASAAKETIKRKTKAVAVSGWQQEGADEVNEYTFSHVSQDHDIIKNPHSSIPAAKHKPHVTSIFPAFFPFFSTLFFCSCCCGRNRGGGPSTAAVPCIRWRRPLHCCQIQGANIAQHLPIPVPTAVHHKIRRFGVTEQE